MNEALKEISHLDKSKNRNYVVVLLYGYTVDGCLEGIHVVGPFENECHMEAYIPTEEESGMDSEMNRLYLTTPDKMLQTADGTPYPFKYSKSESWKREKANN